MGSSWSVGMNMTCWVENRKKGSRNEEIKVEADEPDVQKSELIHFFFLLVEKGAYYLINFEFEKLFRCNNMLFCCSHQAQGGSQKPEPKINPADNWLSTSVKLS